MMDIQNLPAAVRQVHDGDVQSEPALFAVERSVRTEEENCAPRFDGVAAIEQEDGAGLVDHADYGLAVPSPDPSAPPTATARRSPQGGDLLPTPTEPTSGNGHARNLGTEVKTASIDGACE